MARTLEDAIRDTLGNQLLQIIQLQTSNEALTERLLQKVRLEVENEALKERLATLEPKPEPPAAETA
jgi:regulator of replication initiation timing